MKEIRVAEIRAASEGLVLEGYPIVFDSPTVITEPFGQYTEVIRRGALDAAALDDTRLIYNHDFSRVPLARTPKTMRLTIEPAGLKMVAQLPDTEEARAIYQAVARGDLSGMSFAFKVGEGGSTFDPATNTRTITKIDKVYEVSVVPFPAYPQTSVEARSAMTEIWERLRSPERAQARIKINQILLRRNA